MLSGIRDCLRQACCGLSLLCGLIGPTGAIAEPPTVAAASDLRFALPEVAAQFTAETGESVRFSFGSSGNLRRQIAQGAPFALFLSADDEYVLALAQEGHALDEGVRYAEGRLALLVPHGSPLRADGTLQELAQALKDGRLRHLAIANPDHAPYGKRAQEALQHAGLWEPLQPHLVLGENVAQTAQFALTGSAQAGLVAYSLALAPAVAAQADYDLIPAAWPLPLHQRMVLIRGAGPTAHQFFAYLQTPAARALLRRNGFALPGEGD